MDSTRPSNPVIYLSLQEAAQALAVSVDVLLSWNENNILKPTLLSTGEVGYSKQQIDQFLEIKNSTRLLANRNYLEKLQEKSLDNQPFEIVSQKNSVNYNTQQTNNFSQINNYNFYNVPEKPEKKNKIVISLIGLAAGFFVFTTSFMLVAIYQGAKINTLVHQNEKNDSENSSVLATNTLSKSQKNISRYQPLNNEGASVAKSGIASSINKQVENKAVYASSAAKTNQKQAMVVEAVVGSQNNNSGSSPVSDPSTIYNQKTNLDDNPDTEEDVFDTEGNIKVSKNEAEENKLIATKLAMGGINQSQAQLVQQNNSSVALVSFLILALSTAYIAYSKKRILFSSPSPVLSDSQNLDIQPQNSLLSSSQKVSESPKIIELFQKTDGTVMMLFQGKEIKISKPELDSESDKFIERLLQIVGSEIKEIEYDALIDENLSINTPLSKLVTRLGFVGIKRDLFFPRTSKTRVHFRKYLTTDDLLAMNLSPDDVINGFLLNS